MLQPHPSNTVQAAYNITVTEEGLYNYKVPQGNRVMQYQGEGPTTTAHPRIKASTSALGTWHDWHQGCVLQQDSRRGCRAWHNRTIQELTGWCRGQQGGQASRGEDAQAATVMRRGKHRENCLLGFYCGVAQIERRAGRQVQLHDD